MAGEYGGIDFQHAFAREVLPKIAQQACASLDCQKTGAGAPFERGSAHCAKRRGCLFFFRARDVFATARIDFQQ